jgi:hypothetical protein
VGVVAGAVGLARRGADEVGVEVVAPIVHP